jgi:hypothetical protein
MRVGLNDEFIVFLKQEASNLALGEIKNLHMNERYDTIPPKLQSVIMHCDE